MSCCCDSFVAAVVAAVVAAAVAAATQAHPTRETYATTWSLTKARFYVKCLKMFIKLCMLLYGVYCFYVIHSYFMQNCIPTFIYIKFPIMVPWDVPGKVPTEANHHNAD